MKIISNENSNYTFSALPVLIILFLPIVFFFPLFLTFGIGPREDELMQYFPCMFWLANHLQAGRLPLWNHLIYGGYSAISDPQSGICYFPNWISGLIGVKFAFPFLTVAHYWLAGLGMYFWGINRKLSQYASLAGAVIWMFSGFMLSHRTHYTILASMSYLPLILYLWDKFWDCSAKANIRTMRRWIILIVAIQSFQILAGHIQTAALSAIVVFAYLLVSACDLRNLAKRIWLFALSYLFVFGLTSFAILPAINLFSESTRSMNSYRFFTENSFLPIAWPLIFAPASMGLRVPNFLYRFKYFGPWHHCELNCFVTLTGLILACFAIKIRNRFSYDKRKMIIFFTIFSLIAIFLSFGRYNPLYKIFYYIPLWNAFRCPARYLVWLDFSIAVLAMFALDFIQQFRLPDDVIKLFKRFANRFVLTISTCFVAYLLLARYVFTRYDFSNILPDNLQNLPKLILTGISIANLGIIVPLFFALSILLSVTILTGKRLSLALLILIVAECAAFAPFYDIRFSDIARVTFRPPISYTLDDISHSKNGFLLPIARDPYKRPMAQLQPFCNIFVDRPAITGYGPMLNKYQRRIFSFELWPTTRRWLDIITRPKLLNRFGIEHIIAENEIDKKIQFLAKRINIANTDSKKQYKLNIILNVNNAFSVDISRSDALYQMTFYAKRISDTQLRLHISLTGIKDNLWNNQNFEINRWDVDKNWRRFLWTFYIPPDTSKPRIRFFTRYGKCELKNIQIIPRTFDFRHLKRYKCQTDTKTFVYENIKLAELPYFAKEIELTKSRQASADKVLFDIDSDKTYIVSADSNAPNKIGQGKILSYRQLTNMLIVNVNVFDESALLIIPAGYNHDWHALIDNSPAKLFCADAISRAIIVPKGLHLVTLQYSPASFKVGLILALSVIAILIYLYLQP